MRANNVLKIIFMVINFSIVIPHHLSAQGNKEIIGLVLDIETFQPVSFANIKSTYSGASTDINGVFAIKTYLYDSLQITHINYKPYSGILNGTEEDTILIFLIPKVTFLNEVKIYGLPSEEKFKYNILHTKIKTPIKTLKAIKNFELAREIYLSGYMPVLDGEGNHINYIRPPKGVNILGLIEAIKNMGNERNPLQNINLQQMNPIEDSSWIKFYRYENPFKDKIED